MEATFATACTLPNIPPSSGQTSQGGTMCRSGKNRTRARPVCACVYMYVVGLDTTLEILCIAAVMPCFSFSCLGLPGV